MLTQGEQDLVLGLLVQQASFGATPRQSLVVGLTEALAARFPAGTPEELARFALSLCLEDGYQSTPPAIVGLLSLIEMLDPQIPVIIKRVQVPPPNPPDIFDAVILDTKEPFLARKNTRTNLKLLLAPRPLRPVVLINGLTGTGKTHTSAFIEHVLREKLQVQHCIVSFSDEQGLTIGPKELASDILTQLGGDPRSIGTPCTNNDRWAQELANCIIAEGAKRPVTWWVVLDKFRGPNFRTDTQHFIRTLASAFVVGLAQQQFRLILFDFDSSALTIPPSKVADETTTPIPIAEVTQCIDQATPGLSAGERQSLVSRVLQDIPDPMVDLRVVGARLREVIKLTGAGP
jgi:hypothetical protein